MESIYDPLRGRRPVEKCGNFSESCLDSARHDIPQLFLGYF